MSFQAYLDTIEKKTGLTPRELLAIAKKKGFDGPDVKANDVVAWLKDDYDLGRGHAMALVHVIKNGPKIDPKHVGSSGSHRDESDTLWLDGIATKPSLSA
ncbi:MAG TPA: DUF4287 domain-containing protein [Jiangellaceae bacterium]